MTLIHRWAFIGAAHSDRSMHAVIGRVKIKPDRASEALALLTDSGTAMLQGMAARPAAHKFRDMPDASATFISVDVCQIVRQA